MLVPGYTEIVQGKSKRSKYRDWTTFTVEIEWASA
jgi:hypothetical protein